MPVKYDSNEYLVRLFQRNKVVTLAEILKTLKISRMTALRRMNKIGYLASCSHARQYYTLKDIPEFDKNGLWRHLSVLFSKDGTLINTVERFVEDSEDGRLHCELQELLELRVHNTLADLVTAKRIGRQQVSGVFLYVSANKKRAAAQVKWRSEVNAATLKVYPPTLIIEVLLDVIHSAKAISIDPVATAGRLVARGIVIAADAVSKILQEHGVVKKTVPSRSKRSQS